MPLADIATRVMLGHSLREQGITEIMRRWQKDSAGMSRRRPSPSPKLRGMDAYLLARDEVHRRGDRL